MYYSKILAGEWTGYQDLIFDKLYRWSIAAMKMLPNLVVAIIVLVLFWLFARLLRRLAWRLVWKMTETAAISGLVASTVYLLLLLMGLFISLNVLRLDKAVTSLLAGAGIIGLALGFAFQDLTANFISGIFITFRKPFAVGHTIETNGFTGTVNNIQLRSTTMITADGLHVMIPNKEIFQKPIINHSLTPLRRITLTFTLPVSERLPEAEKIMLDIVRQNKSVLTNQPRTVRFDSIDGGNVKALLCCWVNNEQEGTFEDAVHELIVQVTGALKKAGLR
ncbi:mechanosensitive ion channel family protein [Chitinophaga varians]|uniref:mechanosensitive ion channel family protein n=1 Tax=Chitinophaga varians TaxID=2202339 RepID=UPI0016600484|nr:mechanosensitive ion channel family protein [Chitinophaga varians]MBC9912927.1 mechanosensitive ion channel family protein [Chitinophaga varians]